MANQEQLTILRKDVNAWNAWRIANPNAKIDLTEADLTEADLTGADLTGAKLTGADLSRADLTGADLTEADLTGTLGLKKASPDQ